MDPIRQELQRLIALNNAERWLPEHIAFEQLLDRHGDKLIPGLTECLGDDDADVRRLAVNLLDEAGHRAEPALPALVEAVADPDLLVRVAAAHCIGKFGSLAVAALPSLLPWLRDDHEYFRVLAGVTVLGLDPAQAQGAALVVKDALSTTNPATKGLLKDFLTRLVGNLLPPRDRLLAVTHRQIKDECGKAIIEAGKKIALDLSDDNLGQIIDLFAGIAWPEFDPKDYDRHC